VVLQKTNAAGVIRVLILVVASIESRRGGFLSDIIATGTSVVATGA